MRSQSGAGMIHHFLRPEPTPMKIAAYLIEKIGSTVSGYFHPSLWLSESHELLVPQRDHRIDSRRPPRWQKRSKQCDCNQGDRCSHEQRNVRRLDAVEHSVDLRRQQTGGHKSAADTYRNAAED